MQDGLCSFLLHSWFAPDSEGSGLQRAEQHQSFQPSSLWGWESLRLPFGKEIERKVEKETWGKGVREDGCFGSLP